MQVHETQPQNWLSYAIPVVMVLVVFGLRMRRMTQLRPLRLERLWVVPALYLVVVAFLFAQHPPTPLGWSLAGGALALGCGLGWQRGKFMEIHVDPETHALNQKASVAGMAFLIVLILARYLARALEGDMHLDVNLVVDSLAAFALGMFALTRLEMYLRARRLLEEARARRAS
jgi:hypothetical protein